MSYQTQTSEQSVICEGCSTLYPLCACVLDGHMFNVYFFSAGDSRKNLSTKHSSSSEEPKHCFHCNRYMFIH